jgi:PRC-barrel domain
MKSNTDQLCYLEASKVLSPAGGLSRVDLRSPDNKLLGDLDGVVIDPEKRRLRYFVVTSPGWFNRRRYLVPADAAPRIDAESHTLRIDLNPRDVCACEEFDGSLREFSDDDLIAATFARTA